MFYFLSVLLVAIGLSMDTFSISLSYGTFNFKKKYILKMSIIVGIFHFFMPIIGSIIGDILLSVLPINEKIIIGLILLTISVDIFLSLLKKEEIKPIKKDFDLFLLSFFVSIDSFSTGIALDVFKLPHIFVVSVFMVVSFLFTYLGLSCGKRLYDNIGRKAEYIGIIILLSLSIFYLIY